MTEPKRFRPRPLICESRTAHTPESLTATFGPREGVVLLQTSLFDPASVSENVGQSSSLPVQGTSSSRVSGGRMPPELADKMSAPHFQTRSKHSRYSLVTARPFLALRAFGSRCEIRANGRCRVQFGNPWWVLDNLMARYELLDEIDLPFPLGGCFGYWGYELKNFVEPKLPRAAVNDLELPDCQVGFYDSLVVFDHALGKTWVVATGLHPDGSRDTKSARRQIAFWESHLHNGSSSADQLIGPHGSRHTSPVPVARPPLASTFSRSSFIAAVERAQRYIRAGDIYQVNLAQRLSVPCSLNGWQMYRRLLGVSPAPFSAYLDCGSFQIASSSPELFLRLSGTHLLTRPIKGTRPRSTDPVRDAELSAELQSSEKELAELVMITDLLRNDLGKICEYGSVSVPELVRLERYAQVQHLVSTVEGHLRPELTHLAALASCFPGGSITGAPKFRAMEIIDELEPVTRGPYTGALGYLGFNRESQLSILIRAAICRAPQAYFSVGAGIVADSAPAAEYEETLAKAAGFRAAIDPALRFQSAPSDVAESTPPTFAPPTRTSGWHPSPKHGRLR